MVSCSRQLRGQCVGRTWPEVPLIGAVGLEADTRCQDGGLRCGHSYFYRGCNARPDGEPRQSRRHAVSSVGTDRTSRCLERRPEAQPRFSVDRDERRDRHRRTTGLCGGTHLRRDRSQGPSSPGRAFGRPAVRGRIRPRSRGCSSGLWPSVPLVPPTPPGGRGRSDRGSNRSRPASRCHARTPSRYGR